MVWFNVCLSMFERQPLFDALLRPAIENPAVTAVSFVLDEGQRPRWERDVRPAIAGVRLRGRLSSPPASGSGARPRCRARAPPPASWPTTSSAPRPATGHRAPKLWWLLAIPTPSASLIGPTVPCSRGATSSGFSASARCAAALTRTLRRRAHRQPEDAPADEAPAAVQRTIAAAAGPRSGARWRDGVRTPAVDAVTEADREPEHARGVRVGRGAVSRVAQGWSPSIPSRRDDAARQDLRYGPGRVRRGATERRTT